MWLKGRVFHLKGTFKNYVCTKGGRRGGQLGAILCKLFRLEVYIKRGGGGKKSGKYANVVYVRPLSRLKTLNLG